MKNKTNGIIIVGAGLSGLSAAITFAEKNIPCALVSYCQSERAQSVLAEGGINAALDTMGESDSTEFHFEDTMRGGVYLADSEAVRGLAENAPDTVKWLASLGVPFNMKDGKFILRNFGGQKKKRTAYAKSSTGKMIMTSLIDEARRYEARGLINRFPHHEFKDIITENGECKGVRITDRFSGKTAVMCGTVLLCCGGMNGIFPGMTTGTVHNSGNAAAAVFSHGVKFGNLEMIQYHPTTVGISGKRCLVTEAARGEGGRLYIERNGEKWYFMEEKYPELKNLMPRDVVAREMFFVRRLPGCGDTVYLDMTGLSDEVWEKKLPDLRSEIISYLSIDPKNAPVPVKEGIHYFMGGIYTDKFHRTSMKNLYAAGECCCQYHGANRLGGNSMLGAVYGGRTAAGDILENYDIPENFSEPDFFDENIDDDKVSSEIILNVRDILLEGLGIVRNAETLERSLEKLNSISKKDMTMLERKRLGLAKAMLLSAIARKESRGAHYREDHPQTDDNFRQPTISQMMNDKITVSVGGETLCADKT